VRAALESFQKEKALAGEGEAYLMLARSLLSQDKPKDAQRAIDRALVLPQKSLSFYFHLSLGLQRARVAARLGKTAEARRRLEDLLSEATMAAWVEYQLEARMALGEIEVKSENPAAGQAHLKALEKEATAADFGLIARKAAVAVSHLQMFQ